MHAALELVAVCEQRASVASFQRDKLRRTHARRADVHVDDHADSPAPGAVQAVWQDSQAALLGRVGASQAASHVWHAASTPPSWTWSVGGSGLQRQQGATRAWCVSQSALSCLPWRA